MLSEDWKKYIRNEKEKYKKLGSVECPAFGNEKVYFNRYGLTHLIYKDRIPRPQDQVLKRFGLLPYAPNLLKNTRNVYTEEKRIKGNSFAYFWTIKHKINNREIRIILRRLSDNGILHFFSIMSE